MKCIKPKKCFNWAWDDICLSLCVPCLNPYRCQYHLTFPASLSSADVLDILYRDFMQISCPIKNCRECKNYLICNMYLISIRMIERGDY